MTHADAASGSSDADEWNAKYAKRTGAWSGEPNELLVTEVAGLDAGRALDVACGEGADAVWLAQRGWTVTAVDVSRVAIDRNRALELPPDVAARVTWLQADIATWSPPQRAFGLVSMQFMHPVAAFRQRVFRALGAAVAPGGTLLIVAHHPNDVTKMKSRAEKRGMLYSAEDVASALVLREWADIVCEARPRDLTTAAGVVTVEDTVFRAHRVG